MGALAKPPWGLGSKPHLWAKNILNIEFFKLNSTFKASDTTISAKNQE